MSMFLCPLCGKQASINNYHPENFDDDVNIFHNASLGYRKGFEKILGYDLDEFPELRAQLENRVKKISGFLNIQTESQAKIKELERKVEEEERKRIFAEEKLEEIDIELLLNKLNKALGIS